MPFCVQSKYVFQEDKVSNTDYSPFSKSDLNILRIYDATALNEESVPGTTVNTTLIDDQRHRVLRK